MTTGWAQNTGTNAETCPQTLDIKSRLNSQANSTCG